MTINSLPVCLKYCSAVKPESKTPLGRPKRGWEDNIEIDIREIGWSRVWIGFIWLTIGTDGELGTR
jgi:hypothetical protein